MYEFYFCDINGCLGAVGYADGSDNKVILS